MDGFDNKNELNNPVDQAAQNLSQAADEAASEMTGEVKKATSYEEVYGTVETASTEAQNPYGNYSDTQYTYEENTEGNKANGMQIASLVLGILAILLGCCTGWVGVLFGIIGLILAIVGNKQGKHGIGTAGFVCSIIGIVLGLIIFILAYVLAFGIIGSGYNYLNDMDELKEFYDML